MVDSRQRPGILRPAGEGCHGTGVPAAVGLLSDLVKVGVTPGRLAGSAAAVDVGALGRRGGGAAPLPATARGRRALGGACFHDRNHCQVRDRHPLILEPPRAPIWGSSRCESLGPFDLIAPALLSFVTFPA